MRKTNKVTERRIETICFTSLRETLGELVTGIAIAFLGFSQLTNFRGTLCSTVDGSNYPKSLINSSSSLTPSS